MPKITAVEKQKRRSDRVSVFVDGSFAVGLAAASARDLGLEVGRELAADELRALGTAAEVDRAYGRALSYLRSRPRSRLELEQRLKRYGCGGDVLGPVIRLLAERGLLDDGAFAGAWVRDRVRLKPKSRRALRAELTAKGVAPEEIEAALDENVDETEEALARRALGGRAEAIKARGERKGRAGILSFLARRGFDGGVAARVADEVLRPDAGRP